MISNISTIANSRPNGALLIYGFEEFDSGRSISLLSWATPDRTAGSYPCAFECLTGMRYSLSVVISELSSSMRCRSSERFWHHFVFTPRGPRYRVTQQNPCVSLQDEGVTQSMPMKPWICRGPMRLFYGWSNAGPLGVADVELLTNNPKKVEALEGLGVLCEGHSIETGLTPHNRIT